MESRWDTFLDREIYYYRSREPVAQNFIDEVELMYRLARDESCVNLGRWLLGLPRVHPFDEQNSNTLRTKANAHFEDKESNFLVLDLYNKAIAAAPDGSRAMALAHANRAIILIRLGRYREAFEDCQLALDANYPHEKRLKVYFRQAECVERINEPGKLRSIIEGISKISGAQELSKGELKKLQLLKTQYAAAEKCTAEIAPTAPQPESRYEVSVEIVENRTQGRHVIAKEPIEANDIIVTETAVSFIPVYDPHSSTSYDCQNCARVNVIPFVCSTCRKACYCSSQCRKNHQSVHRFECYGYKIHLWYTIGIAHLGIRCLLDGFGTIRKEILSANTAIECFSRLVEATSGEENELGQYGKVFGLVTNFKQMPKDDVLRYAMTGLMLSIYLIECTDFKQALRLPLEDSMPVSELRVLLGVIIMRHIGQLVCNGHAISELRASPRVIPIGDICKDSFVPERNCLHMYFHSARIFTAIFPQISMFNHDCDPNIRNHFERSTLKVYATRSIPTGSEIVNCYGPHYKLMPVETRLLHLQQQYCFECNCNRCRTGDDTFMRQFNAIRCPRCMHCFSSVMDLDIFVPSFNSDSPGKPITCSQCYTELFSNMYTLFEAYSPLSYDSKLFQAFVTEYSNRCKRIMKDSNQTKAEILQEILHRYTTQVCFMSADSFLTLREYALELVTIRRDQYGFMSLEFLTGCFYLLDIWAALYLHGGEKPVTLKPTELTALNEFRAALSMIGEDNRALIAEYMKKYVILDEETPYELWVPV